MLSPFNSPTCLVSRRVHYRRRGLGTDSGLDWLLESRQPWPQFRLFTRLIYLLRNRPFLAAEWLMELVSREAMRLIVFLTRQ